MSNRVYTYFVEAMGEVNKLHALGHNLSYWYKDPFTENYIVVKVLSDNVKK